ncbi:hypothetical protein ACFRU3_33135 [Streptomyces sp. NPDC056910]|uniref:hypothetical protein n=1 Tax=Streptomyces sp. NPDC056910 TaxID=3345964 RepID=UPI0036CD7423
MPQQPHHHGPLTSIRQDEFQGHRIVIKTTYEVTVDGAPFAAPLMVSNDGHVHCHALPTYEFLSAVDTIRALIKNFPDDFPGGGLGGDDNGGHRDHHPHRPNHEGSV